MQTTGGQYGEQAALDRAQDVVPAGPAVTTPAPWVGPDEVPNLSAPTMRPDEPVTAGMPFGPGPGPQPGTMGEDQILTVMRALYLRNPSPQLRRMLQKLGG